jgi:hypothetical protein
MRYIMRKTLLATTALATIGGVVAVAHADVSITGASQIHYESISDDNTDTSRPSDTALTLGNTVTISMSSSSDNGLTFGMMHLLTNADDPKTEAYISGDFGKFIVCDASTTGSCGAAGDYDVTSVGIAGGHGDGLFSVLPGGATASAITTVEWDEAQIDDATDTDGATLEYHSPSFGGLTFGIHTSHLARGDDNTSMGYGMKYSGSMGDVSYSIGAAGYDGVGANEEGTHIGANVSFGAMTFGIGNATNKATATDKKETLSYSVNYAVNSDITLNIGHSASENKADTSSTKEATNTTIGVKYNIAPGLYATLNSHSFDYKVNGAANNDGQAIISEIQMSW